MLGKLAYARAVAMRVGPVALGLSASLGLGCDSGAEQKTLQEIQRAADQKVQKAEREARARVEESEAKIAKLEKELREANQKLDEAAVQAQASVDGQTRVAEEALERARAAFKEHGRKELAHLNRDLTELNRESLKAPDKARAAFVKSMQQIPKKQRAIEDAIAAFDQATLDTLADAKKKLDRELMVLRVAVKAARAKLPR